MHFDLHPDTYKPERRGEEEETLTTEWKGEGEKKRSECGDCDLKSSKELYPDISNKHKPQ